MPSSRKLCAGIEAERRWASASSLEPIHVSKYLQVVVVGGGCWVTPKYACRACCCPDFCSDFFSKEPTEARSPWAEVEACIVAEQFKLMAVMPASHRSICYVPTVSLPIELPAKLPEKAVEDDLSTWATATHVKSPDGIPSSWFQPGPAPVVAAIGGENQRMPRTRSPSLSVNLPFKQISLWRNKL